MLPRMMYPTKIYLPPSLRAKLQEMADQDETSLGELVRGLIKEGLRARSRGVQLIESFEKLPV
jgi:hypothetical protein